MFTGLEPDDFSLEKLHYATGGGVRLQTPIGPLRIDFAFRLNRLTDNDTNPDPGDRFVFHVTIGEAF